MFRFAVAAAAAVGVLATGGAPTVHTQSGDVVGVLNGNVRSFETRTSVDSPPPHVPFSFSQAMYFKGIPYAADAGGANRWKAPQPVAAWSGSFNASEFGPGCVQARDSAVFPTFRAALWLCFLFPPADT